MWIPALTVALLVVAASFVSGQSVPGAHVNTNDTQEHSFSFTITDSRRGLSNESSAINSSSLARAKRQQPTDVAPASSADAARDSAPDRQATTPTARAAARRAPAQAPVYTFRDPVTVNPRYPGRQQQPIATPRRPPPPGTVPPWGREYYATSGPVRENPAYRPPGPVGRNLAIEIELLRFYNERGILANNRPCANGNGGDCIYTVSGSFESGDTRNRFPIAKTGIISTPPKTDVVDLLMRTRLVLCDLTSSPQPATLRLDVKSAAIASGGRSVRQARDRQAMIDPMEPITEEPAWEADPAVEDPRNNGDPQQPDQDQYSRDRYGNGDQEPQQSAGGRGPSVGRPGGDLVNSFDCTINLARAGYQQAHTAQWQTLTCRPHYPNNGMELHFRFLAYSIDDADCQRDRTGGPLQWSAFAGVSPGSG